MAKVTQIIGEHMTGRNHDDVKAFYSYREFSALPKHLEKFFVKLDAIEIRNSTVTSISSDDLKSWPNLVLFSAGWNKIKTLDENLFIYSRKLQHIRLNNNLILNVGVNLLSNLNELKDIDFRNNLCINMEASKPEEIENLKTKLITQCPQLSTTEEIDKLKRDLKALTRKHKISLEHQKTLAEKQFQRLENLEKIVSQLATRTSINYKSRRN